MTRRLLVLLFASSALAACSGPDPDKAGDTGDGPPTTPTTDTPSVVEGACGAIARFDVVVRGGVKQPNGAAAGAAYVSFQERNYDAQDTTYAQGVTDDEGRFELSAAQIVAPEDCWGTLVDYHLVATMVDAAADAPINDAVFHAIDDGTLVVDLSAVAIQLEAP